MGKKKDGDGEKGGQNGPLSQSRGVCSPISSLLSSGYLLCVGGYVCACGPITSILSLPPLPPQVTGTEPHSQPREENPIPVALNTSILWD